MIPRLTLIIRHVGNMEAALREWNNQEAELMRCHNLPLGTEKSISDVVMCIRNENCGEI